MQFYTGHLCAVFASTSLGKKNTEIALGVGQKMLQSYCSFPRLRTVGDVIGVTRVTNSVLEGPFC